MSAVSSGQFVIDLVEIKLFVFMISIYRGVKGCRLLLAKPNCVFPNPGFNFNFWWNFLFVHFKAAVTVLKRFSFDSYLFYRRLYMRLGLYDWLILSVFRTRKRSRIYVWTFFVICTFAKNYLLTEGLLSYISIKNYFLSGGLINCLHIYVKNFFLTESLLSFRHISI